MPRLSFLLLLLWPSICFGVCDDPARCKKECDTGKMQSCIELGVAMQYEDVAGDPRPLYQKACDRGDEHGCYHAELTRDGVERGPAAVTAARQACAAEPSSCARVADLIEHGVDKTDATTFYRHACDAEDARACAAAAARLTGTPDAVLLAGRSCELGSTVGCELCASIEPDEPEGRRLRCAERACAKGGAHGCRLQAELLGHQDETQVAELLQKSCKLGEGQACCALAVHYQDGAGVKKSAPHAAELRRAAAKMGSPCGKPGKPVKSKKRR